MHLSQLLTHFARFVLVFLPLMWTSPLLHSPPSPWFRFAGFVISIFCLLALDGLGLPVAAPPSQVHSYESSLSLSFLQALGT